MEGRRISIRCRQIFRRLPNRIFSQIVRISPLVQRFVMFHYRLKGHGDKRIHPKLAAAYMRNF
jgi:hypothetical protein